MTAKDWKARATQAERARERVALFQTGEFTLASGASSAWKIECDAITSDEWAALARMASEFLPPFGSVEGVPRGGIPFADALRRYATTGPLLIAEDVVTTGGSMERHRAGREALGVAVFSRGSAPSWVRPIFDMSQGAATRELLEALKSAVLTMDAAKKATSSSALAYEVEAARAVIARAEGRSHG